MNLMGKIFTLLIFFMSICFLVISVMVGAAHRNWKAEASKNKVLAAEAIKIANEAKTKTGDKDRVLNAERTSRAMQLAQLESQLKIAIEQFEQKEAQLKQELIISQERLRNLESAEARLAQQDSEVSQLKADNAKLAADVADKYSLVIALTNSRSELENQLNALQQMSKDLSSEVASRTKIMNANELTLQSPTDHIVKKLDGVVTRIGSDRKLIAIGLGTDDGLRIGHHMDVYRGNRYIGKVKIVKSDFNVSVGQTIDDFMQDRVREGDHVTSRF